VIVLLRRGLCRLAVERQQKRQWEDEAMERHWDGVERRGMEDFHIRSTCLGLDCGQCRTCVAMLRA
jgi:hypothetical protein